jgi:NADH-quinone oxidoreductase subunit L
MVTAGVYMVARSHVLYLFAPDAMALIVVIGALTAFFAATIALVQRDIKRVLAYSTISQIGYMFIGCGAGAFFAAIFHLMTHAFFKACLFLGAGAVIEVVKEQDVRKLGGLKKFMPATRMTFLLASATLAGFPLLSAFFSKDTILHEVFTLPFTPGWGVFAGVLGYLTAILTAFYIYRLYFKTFEGEYKGPTDITPHDPFKVMIWPLWILAGLSIIAGFAGIPLAKLNLIQGFLDPVFKQGREAAMNFWQLQELPSQPWLFMVISILAFLGGWWAARQIYIARPELEDSLKTRYWHIYRILWEKYRVDDFYHALFIKPGVWFFSVLWRAFDERVIDRGLVEGTGRATNRLGDLVRPLQNGYLRTYALYIVLGIVLLVWLAST